MVLVFSLSGLCHSFEDFHILGSLLGDSGGEVVSVSEPQVVSSRDLFAGRIIRAIGEDVRETHRESVRKGIARARRMRKS